MKNYFGNFNGKTLDKEAVGKWVLVENKGWEFLINHQRKLSIFCDLLNSAEDKKESFFQGNQYIWFSPRMINILGPKTLTLQLSKTT